MKLVRDLSLTSITDSQQSAPWDTAWRSPITDTAAGLVLDFAAGRYGTGGVQGTLSATLNHGRASTAAHFDASGTLVLAAVDQPRIDHDPNSLAPVGLLLEPQRENLVVNSDTPANQGIAVAAELHTLSIYGSGSVTLTGAHSAVLNGNGAFPSRAELAFTPTPGTLDLAFSGSVEKVQLETGATASSYIATAGTSVTRSDDDPSVTLGAWFGASAGTIVFSGTLTDAAANDRLLEIDTGNTASRLSILWNTTLGKPQLQVWDANVLQAAIAPSGNSIAYGTPFRIAVAYAANDFAISVNGSTAVLDSTGTVPAGLNTLRPGRSIWGGQGIVHAESIVTYSIRLSDAELAALSS